MNQHVILVDEATAIGGAEVNLLLIGSRLPHTGWRTTVVLPGAGQLADQLRQREISSVFVPRPNFISTSFYVNQRHKLPNPIALPANMVLGLVWVLRLYHYLVQAGPSVVHTMSMWTHAFAALAARLGGRPVLWHMQDTVGIDAGFGLYRFLVRLWARHVPNHIVCISQQVADQFLGDLRVEAKLTVLANTIDVARFKPVSHCKVAEDKSVLRIGTVARLTPWKGHEVALQVARQLKLQGMRFEWLIAGEEALGNPGYRAYLNQLVVEWDLTDCVRFVGWIDDMPAFYRSLDILAHLPIEPEPFGLGLAEAMAAGLAVVASAGGGAQQMVVDAGGILVPAGDAAAAVRALVAVAQDPAELALRGRQARSYAEQTFSVSGYIAQLTDIYTRLLRQTAYGR